MRQVYHEVTVSVEMIGPDQAQANLEKLHTLRPLRWGKIEQYAQSMSTCGDCNSPMDVSVVPNACTRCGSTQSNWYITDQGISVDWFDRFMNGDHRMRAVLRSGATVPMLVTRGLDPRARAAIDDGAKRKFSDDLSMNGVANPDESAALLRRIAYWDAAAARNQGQGGLTGVPHWWMSRTQMNQMWPDRAKEIDEAVRLGHRFKGSWPGNSGAMIFMCWLLSHEENNPDTIARFLSILTDGSQNPDDYPLLQCRKLLTGQVSQWRRDKNQTGVEYEVYFMIRAWNAWVRGNKISKLALPAGGLTDPFPPLQRTR